MTFKGPMEIAWWQLAASFALLALAAALGALHRRRMLGAMLWGGLRAMVQLLGVGFLLEAVFRLDRPLPILLVLAFMALWAGRVASRRVQAAPPGLQSACTAAIALGGLAAVAPVLWGILRITPWFEPHYLVPIGGMMLGNTVNAVSIAADRYLKLAELKAQLRRRMHARLPAVEAALCLGATPAQASAPALAEGVRAGLIPTVNMLMLLGVVQLPGTMTGQILGGVSPLLAVRYQLVIVYMLAMATAAGVSLILGILRRRVFTPEGYPRPECFAKADVT